MSDTPTTAPRISVCLAAYNGERYIGEQLASILPQLNRHDEVVVIDDASTDGTVAAVRAIADPRVRLIARPDNRGYVKTFEQALHEARGDYLLLADQDDVWLPGRVDALVGALASAQVVAGNLTTLAGPDAIRGPYGQADWKLRAAGSHHGARNVAGILAGNMPYYGCAMGVRRDALAEGVLPFPDFLHESHDLWLALYGNVRGEIAHVEQRVTARRFHDSNQTPNRPRGVLPALRSRLLLLRCLGVLAARGARG